MSERVYEVRAEWDDEAHVGVASSDDVPGLVTEADTLEALVEKLRVMVPEMLEVNGVSVSRYSKAPMDTTPTPGASRAGT